MQNILAILWSKIFISLPKPVFFPRASERRVLLIVGVCKTPSHLHIFSSSHLLIFSSSHLLTSSHIFSHLLIFTSSHLHIFSHLLTSSHLQIFIFSHLLTSSHLHIFSSHIFSSCPLALSFFSISLLKAGAGAVPTRRHETQPFRTKWGSTAKNWGNFARNEVRSPKTEVKLRLPGSRCNPFARNDGRSPKTEVKLQIFLCLQSFCV